MKKIGLLIGVIVVVTACTSVQVRPASTHTKNIRHICIQNNPAVTVGDFVPVVQKRLQYHGISSSIINKGTCEFELQYSARRSWDTVTYLSWAELKLYKNGTLIGDAEYKLKGKGGLSLLKWQSVETKMNPVIDALLGKDANSPKIAISNVPQTQEKILVPEKINQLN